MARISVMLIIGGGPSQEPFIRAASELGFETVVFDLDDACLGAGLADHFFALSARDPYPIVEACETLSKQKPLAAVMTYSAHPDALRSAAMVAERFGLRCFSPETLELVLDKDATKKRLIECGVPTPAGIRTKQLSEADVFFHADGGGSVVVKPSAGSRGSAGIRFVEHAEELSRALSNALAFSTDGHAIVETFLEGPVLAVGGTVFDGEAMSFAIAEKLTSGKAGGFLVTGYVAGNEPLFDEASVEAVAFDAVRALNIDNSFFTVDMILADQGPVVLELGVLLDAKMDRLLYHGGVDVYRYFCRRALGLDATRPTLEQTVALAFFFAREEGTLRIGQRERCA